MRTAVWVALAVVDVDVVPVDPEVLLTELDVRPRVVVLDEHPATMTAIVTADITASDLQEIALGGVIGRVTNPLF